MIQDFLVTLGDCPVTYMPTTAGVREKWTGAMLDATGRAYCGALRLDFPVSCDIERAKEVVARVLSEHSILATSFRIDGAVLVGAAPATDRLYKQIRARLVPPYPEVDDNVFVDYRAVDPTAAGLRIAAREDANGLHVWIGFWIFTCDGASIDLLVGEIARRYRDEDVKLTRLWADYVTEAETDGLKMQIQTEMKEAIYGHAGPHGIDARRRTSAKEKGHHDSFHFTLPVRNVALAGWARQNRVTPFAALFTAFQRAVSAESNITRVVTGVPFANRRGIGDQSVVGPLSNTVPVVTEHPKGQGFGPAAKAAQRALVSAAGRQHVHTADLYPQGVSPRTSNIELPFPQLFNAWNSQTAGSPLPLSEDASLSMTLLTNKTCRVGFEITLDGTGECVSGRFDLDVDAYWAVKDSVSAHMARDLYAAICY